MAKPSKKSSTNRVTRITAQDTTPTKTKTSKEKPTSVASAKTEAKKPKVTKPKRQRRGPFSAIRNYFAGAWYELRMVRWPDRATTWKMSGALLGFIAVFSATLLLLDAAFKYLFQIILGR